jgi:hypothetical protein
MKLVKHTLTVLVIAIKTVLAVVLLGTLSTDRAGSDEGR